MAALHVARAGSEKAGYVPCLMLFRAFFRALIISQILFITVEDWENKVTPVNSVILKQL
jgi:hypothetical protein